MKTRCFYVIAALLLGSSLFAQNSLTSLVPNKQGEAILNRDLPIYLEDPITEAPQGTEYADLLRKGFSYYLEDGFVFGGYKDGKLGNYVMGNDGNIYLRQPFSSLALNTYLMLEPVNDTTFVAHTPQCIYKLDQGYTTEVMYATRLVFTVLGSNSFTYQPESLSNGDYNTDMVFIYKDGVLRQQIDSIVTMNGEQYPYELLGSTNANGGWFGFGDGNIHISAMDESPVALPAGAGSQQVTLIYQVLNTILETGVDRPAISEYAEVDDDIYLCLPFKYNDNGYWAKGSLNPSGTISFEKQYIGIDEEHSCHLWMMPVSYRDTVIIYDEDYKECYRIYDEVDEIVFDRANGYIQSHSPYTMLITSSPTQMDVAMSFSDPRTSIYEVGPATPVDPYFTGVAEYEDDWFGYFIFNTPNISVNGSYLEPDSMYYNVFVNGSIEPYTFTPEEYWALEEPITNVPYSFDDEQDIAFLGYSHQIFFYEPWESIGLRSIYIYNGETHYSDIVWHHHFPSEINENPAEQYDEAEAVAIEYFDLLGRKVMKPENGVYIKVLIMKDGIRHSKKVLMTK